MEAITFGESLPGFEAGDKGLPAIIVLQEWWGVNDVVKQQAQLLKEAGFRVLIPDLYKGKIGVDAEEASHLMNALDFGQAVKEIGQATDYLLKTGSPKVGVVGFCMGGALTFASGQHVPTLTCIAPCYGIPPAQYFQIETIKVPILGTFAGKDNFPDFAGPEAARAAEQKIKAAGGNIELHIYPNGLHGFLNAIVGPEGVEMVKKNQGGATTPDEEVRQAWARIIAFFNQHLKA